MKPKKNLYTSLDYESLRRDLLAKIPRLSDRWTDFSTSDLGIVLLELFCGVADMLTYYLDVQASEAFLPTARQRQNVINLCKLIGYRLHGPIASTTSLRFSLTRPLLGDLVIPAHTICRARLEDGDVEFETISSATLARGQLSVDVAARQGVRKTESFEGNKQPGQRPELSSTSIAHHSIQVKVQGIPWTEEPNFQDSFSNDTHFQVEEAGLDRTIVIFGDGIRGAYPESGEQIEASYLETLGSLGNIGSGLITEVFSPIYFNAELVNLQVTNPVPATGGADRETINHARIQAPTTLRSLWKAVTKEDYLTLLVGYPGVAKAQILDANVCKNIRYYQVNVAIAPEGGGQLSTSLKQEVAAFLESRKVVTIEVNLFDPVYRAINVDADIFIYSDQQIETIRSRIEKTLATFFTFERQNFGQSVYFSDLDALLDGVPGVSHVHLNLPTHDVTIVPGEIATLGQDSLHVQRVV